MGSINGAIARADAGDPSSSETGQNTSRDSETDHTPSTESPTESHSADASGTDAPTDDTAAPSADDHGDTRTHPFSSAFADGPDSIPAADTEPAESFENAESSENTDTDPVVDVPAPADSGSSPETAVTDTHSSDTADPAPSSTVQYSTDTTSHVSAVSAPEPPPQPEPAPLPDPVAAPAPPAPAAAIPPPPVAAVAALNIGEAVALLVQTLATAALDVVNAIFQLVADLRATLGIPAASQAQPGNAYPSSAVLLQDSIAVLLQKILSHSWSPTTASSALDQALAAGMGLVSWIATLQPAAKASTEARSDCLPPIPIRGVVTALAAMSLWALLAAAMPGIGGLLAFAATGMRIGYRQAQARMALHTTKLARFVRAGPIGIVRTGTLVSVHSPAARADHTPWGRHLELAS